MDYDEISGPSGGRARGARPTGRSGPTPASRSPETGTTSSGSAGTAGPRAARPSTALSPAGATWLVARAIDPSVIEACEIVSAEVGSGGDAAKFAEAVRQRLSYAPDTGVFTWKQKRGRCAAGQSAGTRRHDGYVVIGIDGKNYLAHRLAWLLTHQAWPARLLDHIDRDPSNNRIGNLREAEHWQNRGNTGRPAANRSGHKGVSIGTGGRWRASIKIRGRCIPLGIYDSAEEASSAYRKAAIHYRGEFGA